MFPEEDHGSQLALPKPNLDLVGEGGMPLKARMLTKRKDHKGSKLYTLLAVVIPDFICEGCQLEDEL